MGWKLSMISIKSPSVAKVDDLWLLEKLGYTNVKFMGETTLEEVINPGDKSVSIAEWDGNLIICEDHVLTELADMTQTPEKLLDYEAVLTAVFPGSEVLSVACHSVVNYHLYALALDGKRLRYKQISGDTPRKEFGERIVEEEDIYARSRVVEGELMFADEYDEEHEDDAYEYTEDQLMEEFTFGVAERHLGFRIDEGEELFEVKLRRYQGSVPKKQRMSPVTVNEKLALQAGDTEEEEVPAPRRTSWLKRWFGRW